MNQFSMRWLNYFFQLAVTVSTQSKDFRTRVGCVVVDDYKRILATGFNGFPVGLEDTLGRYQDRSYKLLHVCHAEANAICQAASSGISFRGASLFVTLQPCFECSKLIIQSGIKTVYYLSPSEEEDKRRKESKERLEPSHLDWRANNESALKMLHECGIEVYEALCIRDQIRTTVDILRIDPVEQKQ